VSKEPESNLAASYPNLNAWVFGGGWVEIGHNYGTSMARALDEGGQIWEGNRKYRSLEEVLQALDQGIADWLKKHG
jgi:hypothetical protein